MPESVRFPENANYGCVDCGSINHTTGDVTWCPVAQAKAQSCPHIATSDEGTSYCTLAVDSVPRSALGQVGWWCKRGVRATLEISRCCDQAVPVYVIREDTDAN